jgi:hypothetical protein
MYHPFQSGPDAQHCVFMFDPESNQFTYGDVHYRITLKKTKVHFKGQRFHIEILFDICVDIENSR